MAIALRKMHLSAKKVAPRSTEITRYWDPHLARRAAKLKPGEQYVSATDEMLVTVAGSTCVLCLRDPEEGLVAMLNFSLPTKGLSTLDASGHAQAERYGKAQLDKLFGALRKEGVNFQALEATLIGGSGDFSEDQRAIEDTLALTRRYLATYWVSIAAEYLGTAHPKKVYLNLNDVSPQVRVLQEVSSTVASREKHYAISLRAGWLLGNRKTSMQFS